MASSGVVSSVSVLSRILARRNGTTVEIRTTDDGVTVRTAREVSATLGGRQTAASMNWGAAPNSSDVTSSAPQTAAVIKPTASISTAGQRLPAISPALLAEVVTSVRTAVTARMTPASPAVEHSPVVLHGLDTQQAALLKHVQRICNHGESHSMLLIGPSGSGKRTAVCNVLHHVRSSAVGASSSSSSQPPFRVIWVEGSVLEDDTAALREISRQLAFAVPHTSQKQLLQGSAAQTNVTNTSATGQNGSSSRESASSGTVSVMNSGEKRSRGLGIPTVLVSAPKRARVSVFAGVDEDILATMPATATSQADSSEDVLEHGGGAEDDSSRANVAGGDVEGHQLEGGDDGCDMPVRHIGAPRLKRVAGRWWSMLSEVANSSSATLKAAGVLHDSRIVLSRTVCDGTAALKAMLHPFGGGRDMHDDNESSVATASHTHTSDTSPTGVASGRGSSAGAGAGVASGGGGGIGEGEDASVGYESEVWESEREGEEGVFKYNSRNLRHIDKNAQVNHMLFVTDALRMSRTMGCPILLIVNDFDLFANSTKQSLLYNLLDLTTSSDAHMAVIGLSTRVDVVELLEKRLKSRLSHQKYVFPALSFASLYHSLTDVLQFPPHLAPRHPVYAQHWNAALAKLLTHQRFGLYTAWQAGDGASFKCLLGRAATAIAHLSTNAPCLAYTDAKDSVGSASGHLSDGTNSRLHLLTDLSLVELCLLAGMAHIEKRSELQGVHAGTRRVTDGFTPAPQYNFQMTYHEVMTDFKGHNGSIVADAFAEHKQSLRSGGVGAISNSTSNASAGAGAGAGATSTGGGVSHTSAAALAGTSDLQLYAVGRDVALLAFERLVRCDLVRLVGASGSSAATADGGATSAGACTGLFNDTDLRESRAEIAYQLCQLLIDPSTLLEYVSANASKMCLPTPVVTWVATGGRTATSV